jgi:hypothetical protein
MNYIKNKNVILNKSSFDIDKILIYNKKNKDFINLNYNHNYFKLEGLFFETEWFRLLNNIFIIEDDFKYIVDFPLIENKEIEHIFETLDLTLSSYVNTIDNNSLFINNIKKNIIKELNFNYIKLKLNLNNVEIFLDDKIYNNNFSDLDFNNLDIKCVISTHGIWKYNIKYGVSWRIIKMYLKTSNKSNIQHYIDKKIINYEEDEDDNITIPNFELEFDI